jgi:hypothetical protein
MVVPSQANPAVFQFIQDWETQLQRAFLFICHSAVDPIYRVTKELNIITESLNKNRVAPLVNVKEKTKIIVV